MAFLFGWCPSFSDVRWRKLLTSRALVYNTLEGICSHVHACPYIVLRSPVLPALAASEGQG